MARTVSIESTVSLRIAERHPAPFHPSSVDRPTGSDFGVGSAIHKIALDATIGYDSFGASKEEGK